MCVARSEIICGHTCPRGLGSTHPASTGLHEAWCHDVLSCSTACKSCRALPSTWQLAVFPLAVPHRASQIARCASQLRIAELKSQQKCHAVSNASHASLLASPHRRDFSKSSPHRKEKWSQKTFKFHRNLKNSCKNEDKNRFGKSLRREVVFHRSL